MKKKPAKKRQSPAALAQAVREERMELQDALLYHLQFNVGRTPDVCLFFIAQMALGYSNMGLPETMLALDGVPRTAAEIISILDLRAFLEDRE